MPGSDVKPPTGAVAAHLEAVRQRLTSATATRSMAAQQSVFVRNYRHSEGQTPGWRVLRERQLQAGPRAGLLRWSQLTLQSMDQPAHQLKLDVYETVSPQAAQQLMIELLTGFQALPASLSIGRDIGDADVVLPGDRVRLFTRGNLAVAVANAGPQLVPVGELARSLDAFLIAAPLAIQAARGAATPPAATMDFAAVATAAASRAAEPMLRWVTELGTLQQREDGSIEVEGGPQSAALNAQDEQGQGWLPVTTDSGGAPNAGPEPPAKRTTRRGKR